MNKSFNPDEAFKLSRLYTDHTLQPQTLIPLSPAQAHYLHNVMRRKDGDLIRLFDGRHGEWLGELRDLGKKSGNVELIEQLLPQPQQKNRLHLIFTPIKKHRQDWMIEKVVELGATDLHPIITQNTEVRKINEDRVRQQIFEAAEQCERFEIPKLHPIQKLEKILAEPPENAEIMACLERYEETQSLKANNQDIAILIGPEGGFTSNEKKLVAQNCTPVTLGETILRCETAAIKALILAQSN